MPCALSAAPTLTLLIVPPAGSTLASRAWDRHPLRHTCRGIANARQQGRRHRQPEPLGSASSLRWHPRRPHRPRQAHLPSLVEGSRVEAHWRVPGRRRVPLRQGSTPTRGRPRRPRRPRCDLRGTSPRARPRARRRTRRPRRRFKEPSRRRTTPDYRRDGVHYRSPPRGSTCSGSPDASRSGAACRSSAVGSGSFSTFGDDVELAAPGVGHHPVEGGARVLGPAHTLVHVDLDGRPPPRLREATGGGSCRLHPRST